MVPIFRMDKIIIAAEFISLTIFLFMSSIIEVLPVVEVVSISKRPLVPEFF